MPIVVIGDNTGDDFSGCEDTLIGDQGGFDDFNFNGSDLQVAHALTGAANRSWKTLIKFSGLSNITGPVTVSSATLSLFWYDANPASAAVDISFHRLLRDWVEDQATYNDYRSDNAWQTPGGTGDNDRVSTASSTHEFGTSAPSDYEGIAGLAADTEDFINGDASNYGWIGIMEAVNDEARQFQDSENTDGERPYLTVDYTEGGSTQPPRSMHQFRLRAA